MQHQYPIEEISLADINLNRETQVRASVDEETIIRYFDVMVDVEARDKFPPVTLFRDESGKLWLADGHHRIMAALRRKFPSILAIVRPGTKDDAIWEAASANSRNGLPLGRADVRRAVIMVLETFPNKSTTVIAEAIGCSHQYVSKIKGQVAISCNLTESAKVEGKDGKMYKAKKTKKAKSKTVSAEPAPVAAATPDEPGAVIETVTSDEPSPVDESTPDIAQQFPPDNAIVEAKAEAERILETIAALGKQITAWFDKAPVELHRDF
ncbi:MAG: hypothetical protein FWD31_04400, partial [Planctomycetaceae bacterium]|nr:hypothetical protein [Planctomycetaceae bacterium]